jgi:hypothetical protein
VTQHPIEKGAEVADHLIAKPDTLEFELVLSNTPIEYLAALTNFADRAERAFGDILLLQAEGHLAYIFTRVREYENMALTSWELPRNAQMSNSLFPRISFQEVVTVESQLTEAPEPAVERAKPRKSGGKKAKKDPSLTVADKSTSLIAQTLDWIAGGTR